MTEYGYLVTEMNDRIIYFNNETYTYTMVRTYDAMGFKQHDVIEKLQPRTLLLKLEIAFPKEQYKVVAEEITTHMALNGDVMRLVTTTLKHMATYEVVSAEDISKAMRIAEEFCNTTIEELVAVKSHLTYINTLMGL